ncbi:MJ0042-type zinc finger domain-containing protein [Halopseudomonas pachastrellae]|nr:MJ0042-type zinc finger domain-containing protein [Halopseudomonas pachastrellae]
MSELQVTQCPFCKTHFRLTQEQLQAAAGNVRCGACLKVFNALPAGRASPLPSPLPVKLSTSSKPC